VAWKVGNTRITAVGAHYGPGFTLEREGRSPSLHFIFRDESEAAEAAKLLQKVLSKAVAIG